MPITDPDGPPCAVRKIIHIDMDAFYASVEQRDRPELRGKPVIVGGDPDRRGVVAACSYEARRYGIHSAMAAVTARRRCPRAVFLRPRFEVYKAVSRQIQEILFRFTDLVEPLSLDEAFLDVTRNKKEMASATRIAGEIKAAIRAETGLVASAGVSFNKFLAKIASDFQKPDGLTVVPPEAAVPFIDGLEIGRFYGVGRSTESRMHALGIRTGADLRRAELPVLLRHFGKAGRFFYAIARGRDDRPVTPERIRKSLGKETTLSEDIDDPDQMLDILRGIASRLEQLVRTHRIQARTVVLKVKYADFQIVTRSVTLDRPVETASVMMRHVSELLPRTAAGSRKVRLLGITLSNFIEDEAVTRCHRQLPLPFLT
jgi:DNA polymerase-4